MSTSDPAIPVPSDPVPPDLPGPDRPLGPEGLGLRMGPAVPEREGPGVWRALFAPAGLDGPPGVLQGGLATAVAVDLARDLDHLGAPLHAVSARLAAPTLLGVPFAARVVPGASAGWYEVETWQQGRRLATATVELTGADTLGALADLVALADGPPPGPASDLLFPDCFVCGLDNPHELALRTPPAFRAAGQLSVPWIPDERLADPSRGDRIAPLIVSAALDCPAAWAILPHAVAQGYGAAVLGSMRMRIAHDVEPLDPVRVTAVMDGAEGRKLRSRSAVIDSDGRPLAVFDAVNIAVDVLPSGPVRSAAR